MGMLLQVTTIPFNEIYCIFLSRGKMCLKGQTDVDWVSLLFKKMHAHCMQFIVSFYLEEKCVSRAILMSTEWRYHIQFTNIHMQMLPPFFSLWIRSLGSVSSIFFFFSYFTFPLNQTMVMVQIQRCFCM